jgi:hypothetical protein
VSRSLIRCTITALIAVIAVTVGQLRTPAAVAEPMTLGPSVTVGDQPAADLSQKAAQFRRLAAWLRTAKKKIPKSLFDVNALVSEIGKDPEILRQWVANKTYLVPYRGLLRGASGVLFDRRGNSLDRALLLAAMLQAAGLEVRLARGTLGEADIAKLMASMTLPAAPPRSPPAGDRELNKLFTEQTGIDAAIVAKVSAEIRDARKQAAEIVKNHVATQVPALSEAMSALKAANDDLHKRSAARLADHWWVQRKDGANWVDLELSTPNGAALVPAATTFAPNRVPDELQCKATIRLTVEFWEPSGLRQQVVLNGTLRPADLAGVPITLTHRPAHVAPLKVIRQDTNPEQYVEKLVADTNWYPYLKTADRLFIDRSFSTSGEIAKPTASQISDPQALGGATGGAFGAFERALGGSSAKPAPADKLTAEWLDITLNVPGEPPVVHRRTIFDLLSAAKRAVKPVSQPIIDAAAKQRRALALSDSIDLLFMPTDLPPDYLAGILASDLAIVYDQIAQTLSSAAHGQKVTFSSDLPQVPLPLYAFAMQRWRGVVGDSLFISRANVIMLRRGLRQHEKSAFTEFTQFDIVENTIDVHPAAQGSPFLLRLARGVKDTAVEATLLGGSDGTNTSMIFESDRAAGQRWIRVTNAAAVGALRLPADDRERIAATVAKGYVALVRPQPVKLGDSAGATWWRIDPKTGSALGVGPDGAGQSTMERVALGINMTTRAFSMAVCMHKYYKAVQTTNWRQGVGAALCMFAVLVSTYAKFASNSIFFPEGPMMSKGAADLTDAVSKAVGVGGYTLL